ncbi:class I SAM-dependent RNA methyltransferase [Polycladidibacter stylochi]|uniref:class I SAM-dependent RNA methyltransferase n=1 Tax=Polycladidibacter stylochi TaxID=1807766 RepID=UPI00082D6F4F|nr:class I SAM-dependent RNA methyltransferase [Pseudovibrio stylochi]
MSDHTQNYKISHMAHKGDGVAVTPNGEVYVPFTLPGEVVSLKLEGKRARLEQIVSTSDARVAPVCGHFGVCGGCNLQHMSDELYSEFKQNLVREALLDRGLELPLDGVQISPRHSRRRAVFTATRAGHKILLGFHEARSHKLVDLQECPVLDKRIVSRIGDIKKLASLCLPRKGDVKLTVIASETGLDIAIQSDEKTAHKRLLELSQATMALNFARVTLNGEMVLEAKQPTLAMGKATVPIAPGGFIQATQQAEDAMSALVMEGLRGCKNVADLFCGVGTFSFHIAEKAKVCGYESDKNALKAFDMARRQVKGLKSIHFEQRDLFRRPLTAQELYNFAKGFDGVVFDPPRAGAHAQAKELAKSKVRKIVAISCNPASLARDLKELIDGGYSVKKVVPIDQFIYSAHVEVVALLERVTKK